MNDFYHNAVNSAFPVFFMRFSFIYGSMLNILFNGTADIFE